MGLRLSKQVILLLFCFALALTLGWVGEASALGGEAGGCGVETFYPSTHIEAIKSGYKSYLCPTYGRFGGLSPNVCGYVKDNRGNPIPGVLITLYYSEKLRCRCSKYDYKFCMKCCKELCGEGDCNYHVCYSACVNYNKLDPSAPDPKHVFSPGYVAHPYVEIATGLKIAAQTNEEGFYQIGPGDYKKDITLEEGLFEPSFELDGTLSVSQKITPPERESPSIEGVILSGAEIQHELKLNSTPPKTYSYEYQGRRINIDFTKIKVVFKIDPPSQITGQPPFKANENGIATTTIKFNPSEAEGLGGVIYARASYPAKLVLKEGELVASEEVKTAIVKIRPICGSGQRSSNNRDNLISDIKYDPDELTDQFKQAIEEFGEDKITATHYLDINLLHFLAHHGGEGPSPYWLGLRTTTITCYTGKEEELAEYIDAYPTDERFKITPGELLEESLTLNDGDITNALLTVHTFLRSAARGGENWPVESLTPEEDKAILKKVDNGEALTYYENERYKKILKKNGAIADEDRFKKLVQLRPKDNMGAWYHLFGTATLSVSTQSAYIIEGLVAIGHMEMEIANAQNRAIIWVEEALISGDIEKDPNEYCIDNYGLALGNFLISKYEKVDEERLPHSSLSECFRLHFSEREIRGNFLQSPISFKVTDKRSGKYFKLDQESRDIEGTLPARFILLPEGETFGLLLLVENSDLDMEFEAIKDGKFSFYSYDFATRTGADYADIKVRKGDSFTLSTEIENIEKPLIKSDSTEIPPVIDHISKEEEEEIRRQARETAAAAMPITPTATPKVRVEPPPFPPTPTPTPLGFEAVFAIAVLLAVAYPVLMRKRK